MRNRRGSLCWAYCIAGLLLVSGCSASSGKESAHGPVALKGAGATAPNVLYSKWVAEYRRQNPGVDLQYDPIGSGGGIQALKAETVDFAGSEIPLSDEEMAKMKVKPLHFPTVVGAIVPVYNVPKAGVLKFTGAALAGIFSGRIRKWNDPELKRANPDAPLPASTIVVTHRSDASGTTYTFTDYLSQVSDTWKNRIGRGAVVQWPTGESASGNAAAADLVKKTPNSIGYVELNFAVEQKLTYGEVGNASGAFRKADFHAVGAAADAAENMKSDFRISLVNPQAQAAYPICTITWLIVPSHTADPAKLRAIKEFLRWIYSDEGLKIALTTNYGVLQPPLLDSVRDQVAKIH